MLIDEHASRARPSSAVAVFEIEYCACVKISPSVWSILGDDRGWELSRVFSSIASTLYANTASLATMRLHSWSDPTARMDPPKIRKFICVHSPPEQRCALTELHSLINRKGKKEGEREREGVWSTTRQPLVTSVIHFASSLTTALPRRAIHCSFRAAMPVDLHVLPLFSCQFECHGVDAVTT